MEGMTRTKVGGLKWEAGLVLFWCPACDDLQVALGVFLGVCETINRDEITA